MSRPPELTFQALARNGVVVAGVLLLLVGLGNLWVGHSKMAQYQEVVATSPPAPRDLGRPLPTASENEERRTIALSKLGYYQLLFTVGQGLSAVGFLLLALGVLQVRMHPLSLSND